MNNPLVWGFVGFLVCLLASGLFRGPLWLGVGGGVACLIIGAWGQNMIDAWEGDDGEEDADDGGW